MPCQDSTVCNAPAVAGIKIEFLGCQTDEAMPSRKACLPRAECFQDMMKCITMPSTFPDMGLPQDDGGGFPDLF